MASDKFKYIQKRFTYFLSSDVDPQSRQIWWQNQQALIAIWGGWFWGKGYGKGLQKFGYIPEAQSDFIFSAYAEEVGMVWSLGLLFLYFYLSRYVISNLQKIRNEHSRLLGVGIISLIIVQVFVNIWVNIKIMPNTWLTLPFISYGGTAMMVNLIELVLLYNIIRAKE
jgi:cell division protein FtsW